MEFVETYNEDEVIFLSKEAAQRACEAHEIVEGIATEFGVDLSKSQNLKSNFRIFITDSKEYANPRFKIASEGTG